MTESRVSVDVDAVDFFSDNKLLHDPYEYLAAVRSQCPVRREPHHDVVMVTGYEEAVAIYNDNVRFSSCTSVTGPFPGFPVPLVADDISELIEKHRHELPFNDQLPSLDPPVHTDHRALLSRMLTPKRLKENEEFMWRLADRQFDEALASGGCEFVADFGNPFAMLVIADLLGVPESDHDDFRGALLNSTGTIGSSGGDAIDSALSKRTDRHRTAPVASVVMSDSQTVRAEPARPARRPRRWGRFAIVSTILLLLFAVPWWTLLAAGTAWPTAVVVTGSLVFLAAFVALPVAMTFGHGRAHADWAAATADALLGAVWVLFVWSVLAQVLRLILLVSGVEDPTRSRVVAGAVVAVVVVLLAWGYVEAMRVPRVRSVDVAIPTAGPRP